MFLLFFITPGLNCVEENLSETFCSCTENLNCKHSQPDKHRHNITIIRYPQVNKLLEFSLITISEALYPKVLLKNMAKTKYIFSPVWFFLPSQLTDELDRVIWNSQVLNIITASALYKSEPAVSSSCCLQLQSVDFSTRALQ